MGSSISIEYEWVLNRSIWLIDITISGERESVSNVHKRVLIRFSELEPHYQMQSSVMCSRFLFYWRGLNPLRRIQVAYFKPGWQSGFSLSALFLKILRIDQAETVGSRQISEIKLRRTDLCLRWVIFLATEVTAILSKWQLKSKRERNFDKGKKDRKKKVMIIFFTTFLFSKIETRFNSAQHRWFTNLFCLR